MFVFVFASARIQYYATTYYVGKNGDVAVAVAVVPATLLHVIILAVFFSLLLLPARIYVLLLFKS